MNVLSIVMHMAFLRAKAGCDKWHDYEMTVAPYEKNKPIYYEFTACPAAEIATKLQKNLSFGVTVYSGLAGAVVGILQLVLYAGASSELVWLTVGGVLNFVAGLPIYLSFKKGIFYGVQ